MRYDLENLLTFNRLSRMPQRQVMLGYLSYMAIGTLLLSLPWATKTSVSVIDNLFSVTSAVSTTGLSTIIVPESYTIFGQIVLLALIQIGGIGYMTLSSFVMYRMTHHFIRIKDGVLRAEFSMPDSFRLHNLVQSIVVFTIIFELIGAVVLSISFAAAGADSPMWSGLFHSVSSFCTAGFSTYNNGLEGFRDNWAVNLTVAALSYAGAMGFIVMHDLWSKLRSRSYRVTFTTKLIVTITTFITVMGTAQLYFLEPSIDIYPPMERLLVSFFQTMSAMTTVGFNTISLGSFIPASLLLMVLVMYIGASPSGTGGGLKSTTASAVFAFVTSKLGMERDVTLLGRRLPSFRVESALTTFIFYTTILFMGTYALTIIEHQIPLDKLLFEAASALGTVGLTAGITAQLGALGKVVLILLMYIGRIGVITFGVAMVARMERKVVNRVNEDSDIAI